MTSTDFPPLPQRIGRLHELAYDLWWSWNPTAREVFRRLDYTLWRETAHNPVLMLNRMTREGLDRAAGDPAFLGYYDAGLEALDATRAASAAGRTWWNEHVTPASSQVI